MTTARQPGCDDGSLALTVPAETASVPRLRDAAVAFARCHGADPAAVALAITEAAANAVVHGYLGAAPGAVTLRAERRDGVLEFVVADGGSGLAPRADSPGLGVGLAIIAEVTDSLEIRTPRGGGTEVRMRFPAA